MKLLRWEEIGPGKWAFMVSTDQVLALSEFPQEIRHPMSIVQILSSMQTLTNHNKILKNNKSVLGTEYRILNKTVLALVLLLYCIINWLPFDILCSFDMKRKRWVAFVTYNVNNVWYHQNYSDIFIYQHYDSKCIDVLSNVTIVCQNMFNAIAEFSLLVQRK